MIECPVGYFCPPKTRFFEFKCNEATCGPGAMFNETQIKVQVMIAAIVVGMAMLLGITHSISEHYDRLDEQKRFEERRINNAEKDFLVQELMSLRIAKKLEEAKRMNGGGESQVRRAVCVAASALVYPACRPLSRPPSTPPLFAQCALTLFRSRRMRWGSLRRLRLRTCRSKEGRGRLLR